MAVWRRAEDSRRVTGMGELRSEKECERKTQCAIMDKKCFGGRQCGKKRASSAISAVKTALWHGCRKVNHAPCIPNHQRMAGSRNGMGSGEGRGDPEALINTQL
eukprot:GGOE01025754.1.p1 GENE.GGOE01025754.1~~GGOE01025754.1.p1  ORF type:complete len:104 (+),score=1.30 GGOE01025754.1:320-631(+)